MTGPEGQEEPAGKDGKRRTAVTLQGFCDGGSSAVAEEERASHSGAAGSRYQVSQVLLGVTECEATASQTTETGGLWGVLGVTPRPVDHSYSAGPLQ